MLPVGAYYRGSLLLQTRQTISTNLSKLFLHSPPGRNAFSTMACISCALALILAPSSPRSNISTASTTPSRVIGPSNAVPNPHTPATARAFIRWSPKKGRHASGTPLATPSVTDPHPACVTNAPTASCRSTSTCGAQGTTSPEPVARARAWNPAGSSGHASSFSDQRNGAFEASSPAASSRSSSGSGVATVPNPTYATARAGWRASHARQPCGSSEEEEVEVEVGREVVRAEGRQGAEGRWAARAEVTLGGSRPGKALSATADVAARGRSWPMRWRRRLMT
ncbi:hypothetical protein PR202_gb17645 [Eleusine coracana subsp. coracana]|uniref:Uncharacterized protein n=1 Tax=Eleusine coracana subsp. coracana TaxID=191504 RepID=A0AAV5F3G0_ELECO|nr:hypothetical protein PR202_gb17645 [Eleusine coracana subsp. coracana]